MVGRERSVSLRALGAYFSGFILISTCLSSPPTKVFAQSGKDDSGDWASPPPPPPTEVSAAFVIEERVYADPSDPNRDVWEAISTSPNARAESHVRLRLRATQPVATNLYQWSRNGNAFEFSPTCYVQLGGQADYNLTLQVWSADWRLTDVRSAMLYVAQGMEILSTTPLVGNGFSPTRRVVIGDQLWGTSNVGTFGVTSLANARSLPAVAVMSTPVPSGVNGLAGSNGRLLASRGAAGVAIYNANQYDFRLLGTITPSQLGASSADAICAAGNTAFVATSAPNQLVAVNIANPANPQRLWSTPLPNVVEAIVMVDGAAVALRVIYDPTLYVYDVRSASYASLAGAVSLPPGVVLGPSVYDSTLLMNVSSGSMLVDVNVPVTGGPIQIGAPRTATAKSWPMAASFDRLYVFTTTGDVRKYDVQPVSAGYVMQTLQSGMVVTSPMQLVDIDGGGPAEPIIVVDYAPYGWRVMRP